MTGRDARPVIVWFRRDLRLTDNPALAAATASGRAVIPFFVLDEEGDWAPGGAARWWLHASLASLQETFGRLGSRLILRRGPAVDVVPALAAETGAAAIHWNRRYEPQGIACDTRIKAALNETGIAATSHNGSLLFEPWTVATKGGGPFRVFTSFWRACLGGPAPALPAVAPSSLPQPLSWPTGEDLDDLALRPGRPDWASGLRNTWVAGEQAASQHLHEFLNENLQDYERKRDIPDVDGTSALSPYLQVGAIGPRQVWHAALAAAARRGTTAGTDVFLKELIWREFSYHLLFHNPRLPESNLQAGFDAMPWRDDEVALTRWQRGQTGYPVVDAGMRQLWATGWMHNRVRMVVASFLTKHLLIDWRQGARWFWDTLVDADLASNSASWQWVAGCGADAAPFFRIFNPILQGEKFDPHGAYVRRWVPELGGLPDTVVHKPWLADPATLMRAGLRLGVDYPLPLVDHAAARRRALEAWKSHVRNAGGRE